MSCLKCGRNTVDAHVFCNECMAVMDRHPVKPGTPVHLPRHVFIPTNKKPTPRKRTVSQEEQIVNLKKRLRRSRMIGMILLVALSLATVLLVREFAGEDLPAIGQNYTIDIGRDTD